jgi:hypothetical protein
LRSAAVVGDVKLPFHYYILKMKGIGELGRILEKFGKI